MYDLHLDEQVILDFFWPSFCRKNFFYVFIYLLFIYYSYIIGIVKCLSSDEIQVSFVGCFVGWYVVGWSVIIS